MAAITACIVCAKQRQSIIQLCALQAIAQIRSFVALVISLIHAHHSLLIYSHIALHLFNRINPFNPQTKPA
jgi:hypothetical protein